MRFELEHRSLQLFPIARICICAYETEFLLLKVHMCSRQHALQTNREPNENMFAGISSVHPSAQSLVRLFACVLLGRSAPKPRGLQYGHWFYTFGIQHHRVRLVLQCSAYNITGFCRFESFGVEPNGMNFLHELTVTNVYTCVFIRAIITDT